MHGKCFSVFQPPRKQDFLDPANGEKGKFHFGTDHIIVDGTAEIGVDEEHQKLLAYVFPLGTTAAFRSPGAVKFFTDGLVSRFAVLVQHFFCTVKHLIPFRAQALEASENSQFFSLTFPYVESRSVHTFLGQTFRRALA